VEGDIGRFDTVEAGHEDRDMNLVVLQYIQEQLVDVTRVVYDIGYADFSSHFSLMVY